MNQKIILSGVLTLALISSGCAAQTSSQSKTTASSTETSGASTESPKRSTIGKYGKVKKIIGNSVTIELAELPKKSERTGKTAEGSSTVATGKETGKEGGTPPSGEPPAGGGTPPSGSGGSGGPTGGPTGSGGATGGSSGRRSSFGLSTEDLDLTGEVVELMIPVGVKITSTGTSGMKEIDFADIIQGDTIALYYVEGTETIERVVITPSSTN